MRWREIFADDMQKKKSIADKIMTLANALKNGAKRRVSGRRAAPEEAVMQPMS
jgi:hypothetical protein